MTTVFNSGPVNIESGNTANFVVEFLDDEGDLTVPTAGTFSITYTNTSGSSTTETRSLTLDNSFFTCSWSSTSAALGLATWQVTANGSTTVQARGQIRVIERQGA